MDKQELIKKITQKKEFSQLPKKDVEKVYEKFNKENYINEEKIKLTRDLLRKIYSGFASQKLLSLKNKEEKWILNKHLSTRERLPYYERLYENLLSGLGKNISVIDLGAGINGFSYGYFSFFDSLSSLQIKGKISNKKSKERIKYVGVEAIGQLVNLMNYYFKKNKLRAKAIHLSLFELQKIKSIIKKTRKPRIVFLFKILDSLEMVEKNYSKNLLLGISELADRFVVSFALESMKKRHKFKVNRKWITSFIKENFEILEDFILGGERYIVFRK